MAPSLGAVLREAKPELRDANSLRTCWGTALQATARKAATGVGKMSEGGSHEVPDNLGLTKLRVRWPSEQPAHADATFSTVLRTPRADAPSMRMASLATMSLSAPCHAVGALTPASREPSASSRRPSSRRAWARAGASDLLSVWVSRLVQGDCQVAARGQAHRQSQAPMHVHQPYTCFSAGARRKRRSSHHGRNMPSLPQQQGERGAPYFRRPHLGNPPALREAERRRTLCKALLATLTAPLESD